MKRQLLASQEEVLHQNWTMLAPALGLPPSKTVRNKFLLFKQPCLWCFAKAVRAQAQYSFPTIRNGKTGSKRPSDLFWLTQIAGSRGLLRACVILSLPSWVAEGLNPAFGWKLSDAAPFVFPSHTPGLWAFLRGPGLSFP